MSASQEDLEPNRPARHPTLGLIAGFVVVLVLAWLITLVAWWLSDLDHLLAVVPLVLTIGTVTVSVAVLTGPRSGRRSSTTRLALGGLALAAAVDLFFSASLAASDETSLSEQARDWWSSFYMEIGIAILLVIVIDIVAERLVAPRFIEGHDERPGSSR